jgi:hypothetical protein
MSGFGRGTRNRLSGGGGGHGDDLMITPLLDLFVALIPFLIMSVVLTHINVADVGISKPVVSHVKTPEVKFDLMLRLSDTKAEIVLNGKIVKEVAKTEGSTWVDTTRAVLVELKRKNPDEYKIRIEPQGKVTLQVLMAFMDAARKLKPEDGEIIKKDESTGKPVKLQFLFPNVILRGVYS